MISKRLKFNRHRTSRRVLFTSALFLLTLVGLQGCFRGGWHSGSASERIEKRMDWIEEDLAEELNIRPDQEPSYKALLNRYRELSLDWAREWKETRSELKTAVAQEPMDTAEVSVLLKRLLREKPSDEELETLIGETLAFYGTLDAEQQEHIRKKLARHSRWH